MKVIHFTDGACDPLRGRASSGVSFVPLLEGKAITHVGCMHLSSGAVLDEPALEQACALLIVQGNATLRGTAIELSGGMGIVLKAHERFQLESRQGAVIIFVDCLALKITDMAISTPDRISGQRWPGESRPGA